MSWLSSTLLLEELLQRARTLGQNNGLTSVQEPVNMFLSLARARVWSLFSGLLALLFHMIREFDRDLHRG